MGFVLREEEDEEHVRSGQRVVLSSKKERQERGECECFDHEEKQIRGTRRMGEGGGGGIYFRSGGCWLLCNAMEFQSQEQVVRGQRL